MQLIKLVGLLLFSSSVLASVTVPDDWNKVGEAQLKVLWFKIYDAELYTPSGVFEQSDGPLMLQLTYKRDISKTDLVEETEEQIQRFTSSSQIKAWMKNLEQIWPDISKGDQLIFWIDQQGHGLFFYNQRWIGTIAEKEFSDAFISIWLSDKSSYPDLAKKLRGEFKDEVLR